MADETDERPLPPPPPDGASREEVEAFFEEVLVHYILSLEEGGAPDVDAYLGRFPRWAEELAHLLTQDSHVPVMTSDQRGSSRAPRRGWAPQRMGPYEVLFHVATTGGSTVFKGRHADDGREVALKVSARRTLDRRELERLRREARLLRDLELPRVVPALDFGEDERSFFLAMRWVEGASLQELIAIERGERRPGVVDPAAITLEMRCRILREVAATLVAVHGSGILHRDLKPSNIMVDTRGEPHVIDFGIARKSDWTALTLTADPPLGTPRYLAPELLAGDAKAASRATDVYALGVTSYELLTRRFAFDADSRAELWDAIRRGDVAAPHRVDSRIPRRLSRVIMRAMHREPLRRMPDMAALVRALDDASGGPRGLARWAPWVLGLVLAS